MTDLETRPPAGTHSRKKTIWIVIVVVVIIAGGIGLALFQPWRLFTRNTVDEPLPGAVGLSALAATTAAPSPPPLSQLATSAAVPTPNAGTLEQLPPPNPLPFPEPPPVSADSPAVSSEPTVLAKGTFVDGEHTTTGTASVIQLPDGSRFVRLENFSTSDGPDVHVWITDQQAGGDDWGKYDDGRYVELGSLKGTDGNQNYEIPADADLTGLTSAVIWCDRFNVAFGSASVSL